MSKLPIDALLDQAEWVEVVRDGPPTESDLPYATHSGVLRIGTCELKCYRLNTGEAIFDADDLIRFFGGDVEEA